MQISPKARAIAPSPTLSLTAKVKELRKKGMRIISFTAGEPDFDTPSPVKEAAKKALDEGFTKYTPTTGIEELKEMIVKKLKEDNGLDYDKKEVIVSPGAKFVIFNALFALLDEGDEVLLPSPYWVSYPEQIRMAGGKPVILETKEENGFKMRVEELERAKTNRTRVLILNSPSNPTGAVYEKDELSQIAKWCIENDVFVISDEIYEKLVYDTEHISIATFPGMKERTLVVNGMSKTYSMTGWRIGYGAGPKELIEAMGRIQDHTTSNPTSFAQIGALKALDLVEEVEEMVSAFKRRREILLEEISKIPNVSCMPPKGAFYAFPNVSYYMEKMGASSTDELASYLLEKVGVAVVPGEGFGASGYVRLSFAVSEEDIKEGLAKIKDAFLSI
ncbi:pyridoxal phosphate-dependent aminotransferase [bacterium]|nr:pyridoxal phosphate-dependent aminotransferase [bacterium]